MADDISELPSTYYRVTTRAIIFDGRMRILVLENAEGGYELPGGGWEYNESFDECLRREVQEELGVETLFVGNIWFHYRGRRKGHPWFLRLCAPVQVRSDDFKLGDGMRNAYFIDRTTFLNTTFTEDEMPIKQFVNQIWRPVPPAVPAALKEHKAAKSAKPTHPVEKKRRKK